MPLARSSRIINRLSIPYIRIYSHTQSFGDARQEYRAQFNAAVADNRRGRVTGSVTMITPDVNKGSNNYPEPIVGECDSYMTFYLSITGQVASLIKNYGTISRSFCIQKAAKQRIFKQDHIIRNNCRTYMKKPTYKHKT